MACSLKSDIRALKPLHYICIYLGLLPNFNIDLEESSSGCIYPCIIAFINAVSWMFSTIGKISKLAETLNTSVLIIEVASDLAITTANIAAIVNLCILSKSKVYKFLKDFRKMDEVCKPFEAFIKCSECRFVFELVIVHVYFVIYYCYSSYTWVNTAGFGVFKYFISRDFQFYQLLMFTMLLRYYAFSIKYRFEIINEVLSRLDKTRSNEDFVCPKIKGSDSEVRWVRSTYNSVCGLMDQYSDIFGWHFITIYVNILSNILGPVNTAVVYGIGRARLNGFVMGWNLILLCFIWTGLPLIIGTAIFSACDEAEKEAKFVPKTCYSIVENLSDNMKDATLKEELESFAQQAVNRKPEISAAGFFIVNYNIVFNLMGSISSYLIVLIQFNAT